MHARDEQDFVDFVTGASRSLRRTAYLLVGDWHRAEDAVQTGLVRLYVAWPRLARSAGLLGYARKAVVSAAIDEGRRPWRRERASDMSAAGNDHLDHADPSDAVIAVDERLLVIGALAKLPPRQRATLVLRYYDDLPVDEVAEILGCSPGTVKSQTARGLDALRAQLVVAGVSEPLTVGAVTTVEQRPRPYGHPRGIGQEEPS